MTTTSDETPSPWSPAHRGEAAQSARHERYDLYEDVIVKLRFDGDLSKAQQHAQCQRIWDAARSFTLSMVGPCGTSPSSSS
jgi:hypothetical protein